MKKLNHLFALVFVVGALCISVLVLPLLAETAPKTVATPKGELNASRPSEKECHWKKLASAEPKISLLAQDCDFGFRKVTHSLEGLAVLEKYSDAASSETPDKIIEFYKKDPADSPEAVLKKLFLDKLEGYEKLHCIALEVKTDGDVTFTDTKKSVWGIFPDKEYSAKIDQETPEGDMPADACGEHGDPVDSRAYFEFHSENKNLFAWIIMGQDTPLYDEQSIEF